ATLNVEAGREQGAAPDGRDASWWGVAGYVTKHFTDRLAGTVRAEVFRDVEGARLGAPAYLGEITTGLDWTPWRCAPNVHLRPEARWDHSFRGTFFDDGRDRDQLSLALEALFVF